MMEVGPPYVVSVSAAGVAGKNEGRADAPAKVTLSWPVSRLKANYGLT